MQVEDTQKGSEKREEGILRTRLEKLWAEMHKCRLSRVGVGWLSISTNENSGPTN
jgi:hypothetical protein